MEVVYSFKDSFNTTFLIAILINLFPIIVALIVLFSQIKKKFPKKRFCIIVMIIAILFCFANFYIEVTKIYDLYKTDYKRVEGYVEQLTLQGENYQRYDSFVVDGVTFVIYPSGHTYDIGYSKPKEDGGAITRNGQKVAIEYIPDDGKEKNIIMKLEIEETNQETNDQTGDGAKPLKKYG